MDDSQNTQQNNQGQPVISSLQDLSRSIPASPISVPYREGDPGIPLPEKLISRSLPESSPESHKETGIDATKETPRLTPADVSTGIVHARESTSVISHNQPTVQLPMTKQQAQQTMKLHKLKDSLFWLAMLILKQWQISGRKGDKG